MDPKTELHRNAVALARRKELDNFQRALDIQWLNSRMEDGRMGRCLALIQQEAVMEKDFQERTDHAAIVNAKAAKETALGIEIANVQREETSKLLRRHYLRERDPSLRELSKKLQAGYVCRDLRQQILHNQYRRLQEKVEENHANSVLRKALFNDQEAREQEEKEKIERTTQYRKEIQQQLVNRQRQKQCQYEDSLIEKNMLDDIMRTLSDEDKRELKQKHEQMVKMRNEMETFKRAREAWKQKQKQMVIKEEEQIEQQQQAAADRSSAIIAERQRKLEEREALNQKICAKILADEQAHLDRENIIKMLQEQEYLEKNAQDDISEREKAERVKRETLEALTSQMENRRRLAREQKEKEAEFRIKAETKQAADDAKELEKQRIKHEKNKKYSLELLQQIRVNAGKRDKERVEEERRAQYVWDCDKAWRQEVAEERKMIIDEHVPHLLGYLQAGVVNKEDLPTIREGANKHEDLAKLDIESLAISKRPQRFSKCNEQCRVLRKY